MASDPSRRALTVILGLALCGACGEDGTGAATPTSDAGLDGASATGEAGQSGGRADAQSDAGGSGGSGGASAASRAAAFTSAWQQAAAAQGGVEVQEQAVPAQSLSAQAPVLVSASGEFTETEIRLTVHYRAADQLAAVFIGPGGAGYRFRVPTSETASPIETASFTFSIELPEDLAQYATGGLTVQLAVAVEDAQGRVSNGVTLELTLSVTNLGAIQGAVDAGTLCEPDTPSRCFLNTTVSCAATGMTYLLETCLSPEECQDGACICPDTSCSVEGRQCGTSTCGTPCGSCPPAAEPTRTYCNEQGVCVEDPVIVGCADGTREGFVNRSLYADIAACEAAWPQQSMRTTRTGQGCGNALGPCTVPEDACAPGWHLCMRNGWPGDLAGRVTSADCYSPVAGAGLFVTASDSCVAYPPCEYAPLPLECGVCNGGIVGPIACGGSAQAQATNICRDQVWLNNTYQAQHGGYCQSYANASPDSGVLCCKDPPLTGT